MYIKRTLETFFRQANEQFPVLLVTGPRQVGKTTFLRTLSQKDRTYVTLDDPVIAAFARAEPKLFMDRFPPPILIDEIQYAPELLPLIKIHVDQNRLPGQFWLTGSQQFYLMKGVLESLAGRIEIVHLQGLSLSEHSFQASNNTPFIPEPAILKGRAHTIRPIDLKELYAIIWRGSFPTVALNTAIEPNLFYGSYVQTYLQRDVRDLARVGDERVFLNFLRALAARTGQLLNISDLARDCSISPPTAKQWLSVLQTSGIVYLLEPYFNNLTKRLLKSPKVYVLDTGLCCYLTQWSSPETLEAGAMAGAILETFVIANILKSFWYVGKQAPVYYYRDKDTKEIDLLIVQDQTVYPIEIKKTATASKDAIRHFSVLEHLNLKIGHGSLICLINTYLPITQYVDAIPVTYI